MFKGFSREARALARTLHKVLTTRSESPEATKCQQLVQQASKLLRCIALERPNFAFLCAIMQVTMSQDASLAIRVYVVTS